MAEAGLVEGNALAEDDPREVGAFVEDRALEAGAASEGRQVESGTLIERRPVEAGATRKLVWWKWAAPVNCEAWKLP